jgi:hypothetical protein
MNFDGQNLVALLMVAAAGLYLARLAWQKIARKKAAGCGTCDSCPSSGAESKQVFGIEPLTPKSKTLGPF